MDAGGNGCLLIVFMEDRVSIWLMVVMVVSASGLVSDDGCS